MKAAVLYARVSTTEQANQAYNLPTQEKKLKDYCKQNGIGLTKLFVDKGESARTADRPKFQEMLEFCRQNRKKISCLVVADLSRLARNVIDQGTTIATLKQFGIELVSVDEPILDNSAAGRLAANMLGAMNQFFSDSLSERIQYRMKIAKENGRFLHLAPIGYLNKDKNLVVDPERAMYVREAFRLMASGELTGDAVMRRLNGMGLRTRKGAPLTKQSFHRMLQNPVYSGWIQMGESRVRGIHEPLVSDELFQQVQDCINGKSAPHKRLSEDFPLRGLVRCARCGKLLTAGWAKGRKERYPRYWCWTKGCGAVGIGSEVLESQWLNLLARMQPTAELLAELPDIARRQWETRKARIAKDAEMLSKRLADQKTLNQKAIKARLNNEISADDFEEVKKAVAEEIFKIEGQITALDSERSTMEELLKQAQVQMLNFAEAWEKGSANERQEVGRALFPEGLMFSHDLGFFEPANTAITDMLLRYLQAVRDGKTEDFEIGAGDGI